VLKNKEAFTIALDWDMITKCRNYLIAYIGELDFDISCEWGSDEMSELVSHFTIEKAGPNQMSELGQISLRIREEKKATSLAASLFERTSSGARRISSTLSGAEAIIIQLVIVGILKTDPRY
jgi:hypothetical protein